MNTPVTTDEGYIVPPVIMTTSTSTSTTTTTTMSSTSQWNPNGGQVFHDLGGRGAQGYWTGPQHHQVPRPMVGPNGQSWVSGPQGWHSISGHWPNSATQFQRSGQQIRQGQTLYHAGPQGWHAPAGEWDGYWQQNGQWTQYYVPPPGPSGPPVPTDPPGPPTQPEVQGAEEERRESE